MFRRLLLLTILAALAAAGCSGGQTSDTSDPAAAAAESLNPTTDEELPIVEEAETTTPSAPLRAVDIPGEVLNETQLAQNDCFDRIEDLSEGRPLTRTTRLRCNEPHHFQVFYLSDYPAEHPSAYPGDDVVRQFATESCYREFEPWVGQEYEVSELEIGVIIPNQENFEGSSSRYRRIHCFVNRQDDEPMIDTAQGSGW